jgi:hypothetical protein
MKNLFTLDTVIEILRKQGFQIRYPKGKQYLDRSKHIEKIFEERAAEANPIKH